MGQLKVKDPNDPTAWLTVPTTGPVGPPGVDGPEGPIGPPGDDIYVGPDDPVTVKPTTELWFDTDDARILGPVDLPLNGALGLPLVKQSDLDGDVGWGGVALVATNGIVVEGINQGIIFSEGSARIYERDGGIILRKGTPNRHPAVQNNDGGSETQIITADGAAAMTGVLKFGSTEGDKIYLYPGATPGTTSFGFSILSGTMRLFVSDNAAFSWTDGGGHDTGTEYMRLTNTGCVVHGGEVQRDNRAPAFLRLTTQAQGYDPGTPPSGQVYIYSQLTSDGRQEVLVKWDSGVVKAFVYE